VTDGATANNSISSAYNIICKQRSFFYNSEPHRQHISQTERDRGRTEPCLTPKLIWKT